MPNSVPTSVATCWSLRLAEPTACGRRQSWTLTTSKSKLMSLSTVLATRPSEAAQFAGLVDHTALVARPSGSERIAGLVEAAAKSKEVLGRPVEDPLDALVALPEMAPGEPCPVIHVPGAEPGWLSIWEVTSDGVDRSATAVFQPDTGPVRPDLAITLWDRCCGGVTLTDHQTPDPSTWDRIIDLGVDHAYKAAARLAGDSELTLPAACLRLLVRVST